MFLDKNYPINIFFNGIYLKISGQYEGSNRKSRLYTNEAHLIDGIKGVWTKLKSKSIKSLGLHFSEIDWYDDACAPYETPVLKIERGNKKTKVSSRSHTSIPKDWDVVFTIEFGTMKTIGAVAEVLSQFITIDKKEMNDLRKVVKGEIPKILLKR